MKKYLHLLSTLAFVAIMFRKIVSGFIPIPFDLLVTWFFPYSQGGWNISGILTQPKGGWFASDAIRQIYPWKELAFDLIKNGQLPLWNPYNFSGTPLVANMQTSIFYPLNFIFLIIPSFPWAWAIYIILPVLISSLFMYLFLRDLKLEKFSALFGSLAFASSGYMISWLEWGVIPHAMMWLPFSLFSVKRWVQTKQKKYLLLLVFSTASTILAGYPQGSAYSLIILISYFLFLLKNSLRNLRKSISLPIITVGILVIGITAVQWIPTMELFFHSAMKGKVSQTLSREAAMPLSHFATLLAPDYFGNRVTENYWAKTFSNLDYMDADLFVGVVTLPLALFAVISKKKRKETKWLVVIFLLGILIGGKTPISAAIARLGIPVLGTGAAAEALIMLIFAICCLGAFGLDQVIKKLEKKNLIISYSSIGVVYILLITATLFLTSEHALIARRNLVIPLAAFTLSLTAMLMTLKFKQLAFGLKYLLIFILSAELLLHANKMLPFSSTKLAFPKHILIEQLKERAGLNRIAGFWETEISNNFHTAFRIYSAEGYDPLYIRRYGEFITSAQDGKLVKDIPRSDADITMENESNRNRLLDLTSVKYIPAKVTNPDEYWEEEPLKYDPNRFKLVWQVNQFKIYENLHALPRVKIFNKWKVVTDNSQIIQTLYNPDFNIHETLIIEENPGIEPSPDDTQEAEIISYKPNTVTIKTKTTKPSILLLTDSYFPGWVATINSIPQKILRANYSFRALVVPEGNNIVSLSYKPQSFRLGAIISMISLILTSIYHIKLRSNDEK